MWLGAKQTAFVVALSVDEHVSWVLGLIERLKEEAQVRIVVKWTG